MIKELLEGKKASEIRGVSLNEINDLNSVYMVGTVKLKQDKKIVLSNTFNQNTVDFDIIALNDKDFKSLKRGMRIGINGRLGAGNVITAYSVSILDAGSSINDEQDVFENKNQRISK